MKKHMLRWPGKVTKKLEVRSDVVEFSNFVGFAERSGHGVLLFACSSTLRYSGKNFKNQGQLQYRISAKNATKLEGGVLCCCD